jgi:hypothetical protein
VNTAHAGYRQSSAHAVHPRADAVRRNRLAAQEGPTYIAFHQPSGWRQEDSMLFERFAIRTVAFGLSGFVTLSILSALATTADVRHEQACLAHAVSSGQIQQVVVTGQRLPRT